MPFYEEKLISPLSIRFTQQRIRSGFQDGRLVADTIKEIEVRRGAGDYDIILHAPFPSIEIIRYSPDGRRAGGQSHWFSYDNRRLYCLQRVAAQYWPKRVGVIVDVLHADNGDIRKKLDTQSCGLSVSIGGAFAVGYELEEWSWRDAIQEHGSRALQAEAAIAADDSKATVHDLTEAPAKPSAYERLISSSETEIHSSVVKSEVAMPEEDGSSSPTAEIPSTVVKSNESVPEEEVNKPIMPDSASPPSSSTLSNLIGQLMDLKVDLKTKESPQTCERAGDDASSMCVPDRTESTDSDRGTLETSMASLSGEESMPSSSISTDCAAPMPKQKASAKKAAKEPRDAKVAQEARAARMVQAAHLQRAQMAQWQMAQYQAAQMAQWQQASFAYQVQATQAAQWQAAAQWQQDCDAQWRQ